MPDLNTKEWLITNGLGSFAGGTISDIRTRADHGWLLVATHPPSDRNFHHQQKKTPHLESFHSYSVCIHSISEVIGIKRI